MNINLNNYETFFLLYVDNELSAQEKLSVDEFIQQFPYLKEELTALQEMVLPLNDTIVFDKQQLYRSANTEETLQEEMLLHLDNELTGSAKDNLLLQMQINKSLQLNWSLLKRSQLDVNEVITFPDKSILYRKEKGRWVTGSFVRWAVAAALITAGFFAGISMLKKQDVLTTEISKIESGKNNNKEATFNNNAVSGVVKEEASVAKEPKRPLTVESQKNKNNIINNTVVTPKDNQKNKPVEEQLQYLANNQEAITVKKQSPTEGYKSDPLITIITPSNNSITTIEQPINSYSNSSTSSVKGKPKPENMQELGDINIMPVQNSYAKTAVMNDEEQNTDHILFMDKEKLADSKAGIFFRKIKKTVARHTKIATGISLKIAGVEFAVN